jgi:hypothetical protein
MDILCRVQLVQALEFQRQMQEGRKITKDSLFHRLLEHVFTGTDANAWNSFNRLDLTREEQLYVVNYLKAHSRPEARDYLVKWLCRRSKADDAVWYHEHLQKKLDAIPKTMELFQPAIDHLKSLMPECELSRLESTLTDDKDIPTVEPVEPHVDLCEKATPVRPPRPPLHAVAQSERRTPRPLVCRPTRPITRSMTKKRALNGG